MPHYSHASIRMDFITSTLHPFLKFYSQPQHHPTTPPWHHILGHPASHILQHLSSTLQIKSSISSPCILCRYSKSHKLPFSVSFVRSTKPLEIIYIDVWALASCRSLDGFSYYLVLVDHFSKYIWLYLMNNKYDVSLIFPLFKSIVEKKIILPIVFVYSDNGDQFIKLKSFFAQHSISHYTIPPHAPK